MTERLEDRLRQQIRCFRRTSGLEEMTVTFTHGLFVSYWVENVMSEVEFANGSIGMVQT